MAIVNQISSGEIDLTRENASPAGKLPDPVKHLRRVGAGSIGTSTKCEPGRPIRFLTLKKRAGKQAITPQNFFKSKVAELHIQIRLPSRRTTPHAANPFESPRGALSFTLHLSLSASPPPPLQACTAKNKRFGSRRFARDIAPRAPELTRPTRGWRSIFSIWQTLIRYLVGRPTTR
ncbi:hypothetical protein CEXT_396271 [Caerostris extrusa]|uniref:Uncharacterized protein n=1 Tax=Caerostris extrusa TaxID=172846 RepID=A0AAV4NWF6_CAEEX|nr:hypothetical protein CEXT_396271 [Caerostris extrusa]